MKNALSSFRTFSNQSCRMWRMQIRILHLSTLGKCNYSWRFMPQVCQRYIWHVWKTSNRQNKSDLIITNSTKQLSTVLWRNKREYLFDLSDFSFHHFEIFQRKENGEGGFQHNYSSLKIVFLFFFKFHPRELKDKRTDRGLSSRMNPYLDLVHWILVFQHSYILSNNSKVCQRSLENE